MDSVVLFSILAIVVLSVILYMTVTSGKKHVPKSADEKKREIIDAYKQQLRNTLMPLQDNSEALKQKKNTLLKEISMELSRNIFFDHEEMRIVIQELANYNYEETP
jgi:Tfp pilus assembly protein PilO